MVVAWRLLSTSYYRGTGKRQILKIKMSIWPQPLNALNHNFLTPIYHWHRGLRSEKSQSALFNVREFWVFLYFCQYSVKMQSHSLCLIIILYPITFARDEESHEMTCRSEMVTALGKSVMCQGKADGCGEICTSFSISIAFPLSNDDSCGEEDLVLRNYINIYKF